MIALIARAHLTPEASAAVDQLLRENPIDPTLNRFCKDRPADLMADSATWADDARNIEKTGEWHYIDIPLAIDTRCGSRKRCPEMVPAADRWQTGLHTLLRSTMNGASFATRSRREPRAQKLFVM